MRKFNGIALLVMVLILAALIRPVQSAFANPSRNADSQETPPDPIKPTFPLSPNGSPDVDIEAIRQAVSLQAAADGQKTLAAGTTYTVDEVFSSQEGTQAVIWLAPNNPETGEPLATEPVLAIGQRDLTTKALGEPQSWQIILQDQDGWEQAVAGLPGELLNEDLLGDVVSPQAKLVPAAAADTVTFGGYKLPWAKDQVKHLSMGANHVSCPSTCTYAFDFADGTMFPLLAAKGSTVFHFKDDCANGATNCTNSLTLEDRSTTPWTYQIYLHLRQYSVPSELRQVGALVQQGQYIGDVDDTGFSSGHHLHYMVVPQSRLYYSGQGYYWGTSVDITFTDVSINWDAATGGGRPCGRTDVGYGKCVEYQYNYSSGNQGTNPPTGDLVLPAPNSIVTGSSVMVGGWGTDDRQVTKLQIIANYDGVWREIGPAQTTTPFAFNLDLCAANVPDGPVTLALRVWDREGNQSISPLGVRNIVKNAGCVSSVPPPTCTVSTEQVALYSEPNFAGVCKVFGLGDYGSTSALGAVGNDQAASLKLGQNVVATLYEHANLTGRAESFTADYGKAPLLDRNLDDNLIGNDTVSSLRLQLRTQNPSAPLINNPGTPTSQDSLVFSWNNAGGATKFQARLLNSAGSQIAIQPYTQAQSWSVGSLPAGTYTLEVTGRVTSYASSPVSYTSAPSSLAFTVSPAVASGGTASTPYSENFESGPGGWTPSGLWRYAGFSGMNGSADNDAWLYNNGADYNQPNVRSGSLTSPSITLPASPAMYLRFNSYYQTESAQPHFDQRRVQISVNGGQFSDILQMQDDPMGSWVSSPVISLSANAGKSVRLRFHFNTLDGSRNFYPGWFIDDVSISENPPPACSDSNNNPSGATALSIGTPATGALCPAGDVDYYRFTGTVNDRIQVDVVSANNGFDPFVSLLDSDGVSVITENDDLVPGTDRNSRVSIKIPVSGTYYLKVKAWNHPGAGAPEFGYAISVTRQTDSTRPNLSFTRPANQGFIGGQQARLEVDASDSGSGMKNVEFWIHSSDWLNGVWTYLGTDINPSDGWWLEFNATGLVNGEMYSFYARGYDWAGNAAVDASFDVGIDADQPTSVLLPLPPTYPSTRVRLGWNGSDPSSGIQRFDVLVSDNNGPWQAFTELFQGGSLVNWFIGQAGHTYRFRTRAVDRAGNAEPFPAEDQIEAVTSLLNCTPDAGETNNNASQAVTIALDTPAHTFNICGTGDSDWFKFEGAAGKKYMLMVFPVSEGTAAPKINLYSGASLTPLASPIISSLPGQAIIQAIQPQVTGPVYMQLSDIDPRAAGDLAAYTIWAGENGTQLFMPAASR